MDMEYICINYHFYYFRVFNENKTCEEDNKKLIVVSLSVQPILSLAGFCGLTPQVAMSKLAGAVNYSQFINTTVIT